MTLHLADPCTPVCLSVQGQPLAVSPPLCLHPAGCSSACTDECHRLGSAQPCFAPSTPWSSILLTPAGYDNASKTKQYDAEAIQYTSYLVYPLVACYAVYALIYKTHKSWYSWLLSSLVGAVYSFGFIMMVPQASTPVPTKFNTVQPA